MEETPQVQTPQVPHIERLSLTLGHCPVNPLEPTALTAQKCRQYNRP